MVYFIVAPVSGAAVLRAGRQHTIPGVSEVLALVFVHRVIIAPSYSGCRPAWYSDASHLGLARDP